MARRGQTTPCSKPFAARGWLVVAMLFFQVLGRERFAVTGNWIAAG
jgi:hypothetical protein